MKGTQAMAVAILAGGASRRMGQAKAALDWQGRPLLEHMLGLARAAGAVEVAVAGGAPVAGAEPLRDATIGRGPLGGLIAILRWRPRALVLACDMPNLTPALLQWLWQRSLGFRGWTLPEGQPLCAVYTDALLPWLEAAAAGPDTPPLDAVLAQAPRQVLGAGELAGHGFSAEMFANLNTPAEYAAASQAGLRDSFGRDISDLRISLTDRCNYRCIYCRYGADANPGADALSWAELQELARTFVALGIRKVRLTGGEPLLRAGVVDYVRFVASLGVADIALTTNGHLLAPMASELRQAGLTRVTISLDSLDPAKFARITRVPGSLPRVLEAIAAAQAAGLEPVKINVVLLRGHNDDEVEALAGFARQHGLIVRFIEFMPLEAGELWQPSLVVPMEEILARLQRAFPLEPLPLRRSETARRFRFADGAPGEIGMVAPVSSPFCNQCSRIRLTADGKLRTCLFSLREWDLKPALAEGDGGLERLIRRAIHHKEERHHIGEASFTKPARSMVHIGG